MLLCVWKYFHVSLSHTPLLHCDNQGAVTWVHSESVNRQMRQFNIRQCGIREAVRFKEVQPVHIPGALNPADLFTKEMRDVGQQG